MNNPLNPTFVSQWPPAPQCTLHVTKGFRIEMVHPLPSRWVRFWQRLILGFRWEKI